MNRSSKPLVLLMKLSIDASPERQLVFRELILKLFIGISRASTSLLSLLTPTRTIFWFGVMVSSTTVMVARLILNTPADMVNLQIAARTNSRDAYKEFARLTNEQNKKVTLRGQLKFKFDPSRAIPLEEVEPAPKL